MASLTDLMTVTPTRGSSVVRGGSNNPRGVWITPESLTFPGAGALALALLTVINYFVKGANTSVLWQAGICAVLGVLIYFYSLKSELTAPERIFGAVVAFLNTLLLFGSVAGLITLGTGIAPS